jgi:hypothetical protein
MAATLPLRMPISPEYHGEPVPSMMWPLVMTRSKAGAGVYADSKLDVSSSRATMTTQNISKLLFIFIDNFLHLFQAEPTARRRTKAPIRIHAPSASHS